MSRLQNRVDLAANITTLITCICVLAVLSTRYFLPSTASSEIRSRLQAGDELRVEGVSWQSNRRTLVFALNKNCTFCISNMPFYKALANASRDVALLAIFPHDEESARDTLRQHEVAIAEVRQADFEGLRIFGTPTLALVDERGNVTRTWTGQLNEARQAEVLAAIGARQD